MFASTEKRFLFLSNQKCASTSVRSLIGDICDVTPRSARTKVHASFRDANDWLTGAGEYPENYFSFTIIRNPWAKLVSFYQHIRKNGSKSKFWDAVAKECESFEDFVMRKDVQQTLHSMTVEAFCYDPARDMFVSEIVKFESMETELPPCLKLCGVEVEKIPHSRNLGGSSDYRHWYSAAARKVVRDVFSSDIFMGKYTFT